MAVQIMFDGPGRRAARGIARSFAVLVGVPLLVAAVLGLSGLALIGLWLIYLRVDSAATPPSAADRRETMIIGLVCLGATLIGLPLGIRLLRGKRRLVLFLRRFGYDDATKALSYAAVNALGRSWRLVTLDDDRVRAVGGPRGRRRITGLVTLLTVGGAGYLVWWLLTHSMAEVIDGMHTTGGNPYLNQIFGALFAALFVLAVVLLTTVTGVTALLMTMTYGFARRVETAKSDRIRTPRDVGARSSAISRQSRRVFAPRLLVVTVADLLWQQAVHALARSASAVIIDISVPGESLRWEINTLLPLLQRRCVFVGSFDHIVGRGPDGRPVFASPLAHDIDGHDVLAYRTDKASMKRFARALHATIEARTHH